MNHRRPPSNPDATAVLERPGFSRSDAGDTDPSRRALPSRAEAPTGRYVVDDLDGFRPSELPSAWVSEFDVSDLDGDVVEAGAATTIMQLPPEMMSAADEGSFAEASERAVELLKWRAGPQHTASAVVTTDADLPTLSRPMPLPLPPSPHAGPDDDHDDNDHHVAATLPALSLAMVRAAMAAPSPRHHDIEAPTNSERIVPVAARLRATIDEALSAVLAAQSMADDDAVPAGVHEHLARAVELLSAAQELGDEL